MLKGLEAVEIELSKSLENKDFRIDSQFYTKEPYKNALLNYERIGNLIEVAQYGISISMNEDNIGTPIYRMNEIHNMFCDFDTSKTAQLTSDEIQTFKLHDRDVLFNRTNSFEWVGRTGIYRKTDDQNFIFASYLVRFVPNQNKLLPEYLTTFLNSKYGIQDIRRRARQSINQTNVNPEEVKEIEIPLLSISFQNLLKDNFDIAFIKLKKSKALYTEAEDMLLEELDLKDFEPNKEAIAIKSFNESFGSSGRLDAEYYQPKYENIEQKIKNYHGGFDTVRNLINFKDKNFFPKSDQPYQYLALSNISNHGYIQSIQEHLGKNLPTRARRKVNTNDVIISSIEGSLSSCALIENDFDNSICSTGFFVVNSQKINSETLLVLFKSSAIQELLTKVTKGTILTAMSKTELENIMIPLVNLETQEKIATKIQESHALRTQSKTLLEVAKRSVELAIEQNESVAMEFIKENAR